MNKLTHMSPQALVEYALGRIRTGITKAELREELFSVGWTEEEVEMAYRSAVVALGAPLPSEGNRATLSRKAGAVDVVINFFSFILLGIVATALGTLYFQIINVTFPDALDGMSWYGVSQATSTIHYAIAALLIGFPLYFFAMRLWFRKFREDEGRVESKLSKWLTYLVLLVTAVTMVGDLITIVFTLLQGEITARFFLKALTILVIAGAVFGFYFLERRKIQYQSAVSRQVFLNFGRGVALIVALGIVLGFVVGGSPETARNRTFDQTRANNLSTLSDCIEQYAQGLGALPTTLADLRQSSQYSYCAGYMKDPETGAAYEYRVVTPSRAEGATRVGAFELCATFALPSDEVTTPVNTYGGGSAVWYEYEAGRSCDTMTARLMPVK
jgi:membrane protein YqaA with SNARE-associated domain